MSGRRYVCNSLCCFVTTFNIKIREILVCGNECTQHIELNSAVFYVIEATVYPDALATVFLNA